MTSNIIMTLVLTLLVVMLVIAIRGVKWKKLWNEFLQMFDWYDWWS
jgi:hypothetical protein